MKVLHIWNTAGVAGFIADAMDRRYNTESKVLMRASCDPYDSTIKGKNYDERASVFIARALAHIPFYDIIHVHSLEKIIPFVKLVMPWKPLFLHYHGTTIRGIWEEKRKYWRWADEIFVSTPDLTAGAPAKVRWIPNVVNEELLTSIKEQIRVWPKHERIAFTEPRWANDEAETWARIHDYKIKFGTRTQTEVMKHSEYLRMIATYPAYIDIKREFPDYGDQILEAHSLTGLEMLYMGRKVIRYDGELIENFPEEHNSKFVTRKLMGIYRRYIARAREDTEISK